MKKFVAGILTGAILTGAAGAFAVQFTADINPFPIKLNGDPVDMEGYNINGFTYFKLRDIASVTGKFDVDFSDNTILLSKDGYTYKKEWRLSESYIDDNGDMHCGLELGGHSLEMTDISSAAPHLCGKLFIDGSFVDDNVIPQLAGCGEYVYYTGDFEDKGLYKLNINTSEKTALIKTDDQYVILGSYGNYLYLDGDFTPDMKIYDTVSEEIVKEIPAHMRHITADGDLIYVVYNGDAPGESILYRANADGSDPVREVGTCHFCHICY